LEINKAFFMREKVGALFLDVKGAYDNVDPSILFDMINDLSIPVGYKLFIKNLLKPRIIDIYKSGFFQDTRTLYNGLPQGSVLSPLLFNLYLKNINQVIPYNCKLIQFADDIAIYCSDKYIDNICKVLSVAFDGIDCWLASMGLELSVPKTQFIIFHRSKKLFLPDNLGVTNGSVVRLNSAKYLGILLDSGLRWVDHIRMIKFKSIKYFNILKWPFLGH